MEAHLAVLVPYVKELERRASHSPLLALGDALQAAALLKRALLSIVQYFNNLYRPSRVQADFYAIFCAVAALDLELAALLSASAGEKVDRLIAAIAAEPSVQGVERVLARRLIALSFAHREHAAAAAAGAEVAGGVGGAALAGGGGGAAPGGGAAAADLAASLDAALRAAAVSRHWAPVWDNLCCAFAALARYLEAAAAASLGLTVSDPDTSPRFRHVTLKALSLMIDAFADKAARKQRTRS